LVEAAFGMAIAASRNRVYSFNDFYVVDANSSLDYHVVLYSFYGISTRYQGQISRSETVWAKGMKGSKPKAFYKNIDLLVKIDSIYCTKLFGLTFESWEKQIVISRTQLDRHISAFLFSETEMTFGDFLRYEKSLNL
jgi:hypothetical protein